ncbi:unnamed protein product, partial [Phaeothamnion confervicola]
MHMALELQRRCQETQESGERRRQQLARRAEQRQRDAATTIQRWWRGTIGRREGRAVLRAGRLAIREQWRRRRQDDAVRSAAWWRFLDFFGAAPGFGSDTPAEAVLRELWRWRRRAAARDIELNREDDGWYPERFPDRKGRWRRGFEVGTVDELREQAMHGGVRLPGRHAVCRKSAVIRTQHDLIGLLKRRNLLRIAGTGGGCSSNDSGGLYRVKAVAADSVTLDRIWRFGDDGGVLLFRMPSGKRRRLALAATRLFWGARPVQSAVMLRVAAEEALGQRFVLRTLASIAKQRGWRRLY